MRRDSPYLESAADIRGAHRLALIRIWDRSLDYVMICGLNPSTADGEDDDPTIRKEVGFSKRLGFGGFVKVNAFSYRATAQRDLVRAFKDGSAVSPALGPGRNMTENEGTIVAQLCLLQAHNGSWRPPIILAWGNPPSVVMQDALDDMVRFLRPLGVLHCWGRTKSGNPRHPVRLAYATPLELWT